MLPKNPPILDCVASMLYAFTRGRKTTPQLEPSVSQWNSFRTVLGLDPLKDADGNVIREARLAAWANFRQRALNIAIAEINAKTDLSIALESLERAEHGRVDRRSELPTLDVAVAAFAAAPGSKSKDKPSK